MKPNLTRGTPEKNARPAAEVAAYGVLEGGRAISGVSTCVSVAVIFNPAAPGSAVMTITLPSDPLPTSARDPYHPRIHNCLFTLTPYSIFHPVLIRRTCHGLCNY